MWIKLFESDFILFLLTSPQWFTHPPSLAPFAWLLSAIMEDSIVRCSYSNTLHSLTRSRPILPAARHSPLWPLPAQVILQRAFALMCPLSIPPLALKCLFVRRFSGRKFLFGRCVLFCGCDVDVFICLLRTWTRPPKAETQRFTSSFAQYIVGFVSFKKKNKIVFKLFMFSSVRLSIPL